MDIKVRAAIPDDSRRIAEIHVAAWKVAYAGIMDSHFLSNLSVNERETMWTKALSRISSNRYLAGLIDDVVCGFCVCGPARDKDLDYSACELIALNVEPEYWGRGIGSALVGEAINTLRRDKYRTAHLWVVQKNERAIKLYKRYDFQETDVVKVDSTHSAIPIKEIRYSAILS